MLNELRFIQPDAQTLYRLMDRQGHTDCLYTQLLTLLPWCLQSCLHTREVTLMNSADFALKLCAVYRCLSCSSGHAVAGSSLLIQ